MVLGKREEIVAVEEVKEKEEEAKKKKKGHGRKRDRKHSEEGPLWRSQGMGPVVRRWRKEASQGQGEGEGKGEDPSRKSPGRCGTGEGSQA